MKTPFLRHFLWRKAILKQNQEHYLTEDVVSQMKRCLARGREGGNVMPEHPHIKSCKSEITGPYRTRPQYDQPQSHRPLNRVFGHVVYEHPLSRQRGQLSSTPL